MDEKEILRGLHSLWKENFGDSDEYIELIFSNYFSLHTLYKVRENEIVSSLVGIPYSFRCASSDKPLRGLYLCGLSTLPKERGKGLMTELIEEINDKARSAGFDFTFLIPASEGMRRYYGDRGYHDSFYKIREYYVPNYRIHNLEPDSSLSFSRLTREALKDTALFLYNKECRSEAAEKVHSEAPEAIRNITLVHSLKDWETALEEALISHDKVFVVHKENKIAGVAFTLEKEDSVEVKKIVADSEIIHSHILNFISAAFKDKAFCEVKDFADVKDLPMQVWEPFTAENNIDDVSEYQDVSTHQSAAGPKERAYPFGMIRIFDIRDLMRKVGIVRDEKYSEFDDSELTDVLLRKPSPEGDDSLHELLNFDTLEFSASILLE